MIKSQSRAGERPFQNALNWSLRYEREAILPQYEAVLKELVVTGAV
jgi:hypothetical protein